MPEPELLKEFLGDPAGRIKCPTLAQEMLYGAKGREFQLREYLRRHEGDIPVSDLEALVAEAIEPVITDSLEQPVVATESP